MLTVKIVSKYSYACVENDAQEFKISTAEKTRIITAESIDIDSMRDSWIISIDKSLNYSIPFFHKGSDLEDGEIYLAAYIENERGKTVHMVRSEYFEPSEPMPEGVK